MAWRAKDPLWRDGTESGAMGVKASVLDAVLRVVENRRSVGVAQLVAGKVDEIEEVSEGGGGFGDGHGVGRPSKEGRNKGDGGGEDDVGLEATAEVRPVLGKADVCERTRERLVGKGLDVVVHLEPARTAQRRRAPGSLESLAFRDDVDDVVLVKLEGGEEGGRDR